MKARMRLESTVSGVRIRYWDPLTEREVTRDFIAPFGRYGYVRELTPHGSFQVCECLCGMGDTLMASSDSLARVIRREYRAMRRAEKREGLS